MGCPKKVWAAYIFQAT